MGLLNLNKEDYNDYIINLDNILDLFFQYYSNYESNRTELLFDYLILIDYTPLRFNSLPDNFSSSIEKNRFSFFLSEYTSYYNKNMNMKVFKKITILKIFFTYIEFENDSSAYKYLYGNKIRLVDFKKYLDSYKVSGCAIIEKYMSNFDDYYSGYQKYLDNRKVNYENKYFSLFKDGMIDSGKCYSNSMCLDYLIRNGYAHNYVEAISIFENLKKVLTNKAKRDGYIWTHYWKECFEKNRVEIFKKNMNKIDLFFDDIFSSKSKFNIVDFVLSFGMSLEEFIYMCKPLISYKEKGYYLDDSKIKFLKKMLSVSLDDNNFRFELMSKYTDFNIKYSCISDDDKLMIYEFMKDKKIGLKYVDDVFQRYVEGKLDYFFKSDDNVFLSNDNYSYINLLLKVLSLNKYSVNLFLKNNFIHSNDLESAYKKYLSGSFKNQYIDDNLVRLVDIIENSKNINYDSLEKDFGSNIRVNK